MVWFLRHARLDAGLGATVARFQGKIANIAADLTGMLPDAAARDLAARTAAHIAAGVPEPLAAQVARLALLEEAPDIILVAEAASVPIRTVATTHFELADRFGIAGLSAAAAGLKADGRYERLALDRARIGIAGAHRALTAAVIASGRDVTAWSARAGAANSRTAAALAAAAAEPASLASLTVAAGLLADLAG
jgi:glutamate dehydrogenase